MSDENQRYFRQTVLPEIGAIGQKQLKKTSVLCVGAGGLGSPACLYLAAAGIGRIGIVDPDIVDESNLQRQVLFESNQIGEFKVDAGKKKLHQLNPFVQVQTYPVRLNSKNALAILQEYEIVIDGTDNFPAKFLINDAATKLGIPVVYSSISGFEGQISVFWATHGPCYRCLYPKAPDSYVPNCAEAGVLGALAGVMGSMQALEAIKLSLHSQSPNLKPMIGKLGVFDATSLEFFTYPIPKNPNCPVCSKDSQLISLENDEIHCTRETMKTDALFEISADELLPILNHFTLIDVRESVEWQGGHLPGAVHFPLGRLERGEFPKIDFSRPCVIYCHAGIRSKRALKIFLSEKSGSNIKHLRGGLIAWKGPISFD